MGLLQSAHQTRCQDEESQLPEVQNGISGHRWQSVVFQVQTQSNKD
jgi:hypothetical protein